MIFTTGLYAIHNFIQLLSYKSYTVENYPASLIISFRISESLRGRIAILEYADSSQQLLLQLQKSKKFSNLILQVHFTEK